MNNPLRIGGITPLTSIDFPGRLAAVLYGQGCPWRCGYCHNPELLDATTPAAVPWPEVLAFLKSRQGLLDGVVFSGGEPTLHQRPAARLRRHHAHPRQRRQSLRIVAQPAHQRRDL